MADYLQCIGPRLLQSQPRFCKLRRQGRLVLSGAPLAKCLELVGIDQHSHRLVPVVSRRRLNL